MPEVLGHLLVRRGLQDRLGQLLEQPTGPGQRQALLRARRTISSAIFSSAVGSRPAFFVTSPSVAPITAPLPLNTRLSDQGRTHRCQGSVALPVVAGCADVSRSVMIDVAELVGIVFSGLSVLVIEDIEDAGEVIVVRARTRDRAVACPGCGTETGRVHEYRERTVADVPADGRRVLVKVR